MDTIYQSVFLDKNMNLVDVSEVFFTSEELAARYIKDRCDNIDTISIKVEDYLGSDLHGVNIICNKHAIAKIIKTISYEGKYLYAGIIAFGLCNKW